MIVANIENEYQIDICMKIFTTIPNSYCNFTIDHVIERFNYSKGRGYYFLFGIFTDGEIYYSISDKIYYSKIINFTEFIKEYASKYREIRLNEILNVN